MSSENEIILKSVSNSTTSELMDQKLPTNLNILQVLFYKTKIDKLSIDDACNIIIEQVQNIWDRTSITTKRIDHCKTKMINLHKEFRSIQKLKNKRSKKVNDFLEELSLVFDISQDNLITLLGSMGDMEKKAFLSMPIDDIKTKLNILKSQIEADEENEISFESLSLEATPIEKDLSDCSNKLFKDSVSPNLSSSNNDLLLPSSNIDNFSTVECTLLEKKELSIENETINLRQYLRPRKSDEDDSQPSCSKEIISQIKLRTRQQRQVLEQEVQMKEIVQSSEEVLIPSSGSSYNPGGHDYVCKNIRGSINVITAPVCAALDVCGISYRRSVLLISTIADALNIDPATLILNKSSFREARAKVRQIEGERMKKLLANINTSFLIVHWDGKLIPDNITCKKVDRVPILVSGENVLKIINVPALENGKGVTIAAAVHEALKSWGLVDLTVGVCCDTTAANFGCRNGAATILEQSLDKNLVYFGCRHHVLEILLADAFITKIPGMNGPNVAIFKKFQAEWHKLHLDSYKHGLSNLEQSLEAEIPRVVQFIKKHLKKEHVREDYRELLELCLIFLNVEDETKYSARKKKFRKPGAYHHARWMAKAIYSIKIYLFRDSFLTEENELQQFYQICKFIIFVYIENWYEAPLAFAAPNNDLKLIKKLIDFELIDDEISKAALKKLQNHLYYLSPELCTLALFDDNVDNNVKRSIVNAFHNKQVDSEEDIPKKFIAISIGIRSVYDKNLDFFANSQSLMFFERFKLNKEFLTYDCNSWKRRQSYIENVEKIKHIVVVNDCAERAVHLTQDYINTLTTDEEEKQYLIQFLDENKKNLLKSSKKTDIVKKLKMDR